MAALQIPIKLQKKKMNSIHLLSHLSPCVYYMPYLCCACVCSKDKKFVQRISRNYKHIANSYSIYMASFMLGGHGQYEVNSSECRFQGISKLKPEIVN